MTSAATKYFETLEDTDRALALTARLVVPWKGAGDSVAYNLLMRSIPIGLSVETTDAGRFGMMIPDSGANEAKTFELSLTISERMKNFLFIRRKISELKGDQDDDYRDIFNDFFLVISSANHKDFLTVVLENSYFSSISDPVITSLSTPDDPEIRADVQIITHSVRILGDSSLEE